VTSSGRRSRLDLESLKRGRKILLLLRTPLLLLLFVSLVLVPTSRRRGPSLSGGSSRGGCRGGREARSGRGTDDEAPSSEASRGSSTGGAKKHRRGRLGRLDGRGLGRRGRRGGEKRGVVGSTIDGVRRGRSRRGSAVGGLALMLLDVG
jgi:hypothetical protein